MKYKILTTTELLAVRAIDNGEKLLNASDEGLLCDYRRLQSGVMNILVRESVRGRLHNVQKLLEQHSSGLQLLLVEGYRTREYQESYYLKEFYKQCQGVIRLDFSDMVESVHQFVALPSVAGHPTGGAIDLTLVLNGNEVSMGGQIADFSCPELLPTYSPLATAEQSYWRTVLHDAMVSEGFAPFYGEWWHFSYGDREWAAFYGYSETLYGLIHG